MALINCPECKREISDKALACPQCGSPHAAPDLEEGLEQWKLQRIMGGAVLACGLLIIMSARGDNVQFIGTIVGLLGCIAYLYAHLMAWWHHG